MVKDINGNIIYEGDSVIWYDPDTEHRDLTEIWTIAEIYDDEYEDEDDCVVLIYNDYGEAEVYAHELEVV